MTRAGEVLDIELTDEWLDTISKHCFAEEQTHIASSAQLKYRYIRRQNRWGLTTIEPLRNYFVTCAKPQRAASETEHVALLEQVFSTKWHLAHIGLCDLSDPFIEHAINFCHQNKWPYQLDKAFDNWQLKNVDSESNYWANLPARLKNTIQRKSKKLAKHNHRFVMITDEAQLEQHFKAYCQIYAESWKPAEEKIDFIAAFCRQAARLGWLRLGLLYLEQEPVAGQIWFVHQTKANIFKLAYQPRYQTYSPGTLLTNFMMNQLINHEQISLVDYGMGNEPYKSDWMNHHNSRYTLTIFNPRAVLGRMAQLRFQLLPKFKHRLNKL